MKTILATVTALALTLGMTFTASAQQFNFTLNKTTINGNGNTVNNVNQGGSGRVFNDTNIFGNGNQVNNINRGGFLPRPSLPPQYGPVPTCGTKLLPRPSYDLRPCGGMVMPFQQPVQQPTYYPTTPRGPVTNYTNIHGHHNNVSNINGGGFGGPVSNFTNIHGSFNNVTNFNH